MDQQPTKRQNVNTHVNEFIFDPMRIHKNKKNTFIITIFNVNKRCFINTSTFEVVFDNNQCGLFELE